jgi:hypothetical protein
MHKERVREDADGMEIEDSREELASDQVLRVEDVNNDELARYCVGCLGNCKACVFEQCESEC